MKKTFNDVLQLLDEQNYTIAKDPAFTVRRYLIENPSGIVTPIRYFPTMTEMYADIKKVGVAKFIAEHDASDNVSPSSPKLPKAKIAKSSRAVIKKGKPSVEELIETPRALKNRRESEVALTVETPQMDLSNDYTNNVVAIDTVKKINYSVKVPKYFDSYYFPTIIDNIVTRLSLGRNIYLQGAAGCLEASTLIDLKVDNDIYNIILKNRR